MNADVRLRSVTVTGSATWQRTLAAPSHRARLFTTLVGPLPRIVAQVDGPAEVLDRYRAGLPAGPAAAEALAARLHAAQVPVSWGAPVEFRTPADLLAWTRARGRAALELIRVDPALLAHCEIGSWYDASPRARAARRLLLRGPGMPPSGGSRGHLAALDFAFWRGVRDVATAAEWQRLTGSAYVALMYHRLAGARVPGQERLDIAPADFARHLRVLRRLRFTVLSTEQVIAFHTGLSPALPRRSVVLTFDDGFLDCVQPLLIHAKVGAQLFVSTDELGGRAHWLAGEEVMTWDDLRKLAMAGVEIGSHAKHHNRLPAHSDGVLADELAGSLAALRDRLPCPAPVLAYPNGAHDRRVREAAIGAGYRAAYTTEKGRNGAGTDRWLLRRVSVHACDGRARLLWKALTGQAVPAGRAAVLSRLASGKLRSAGRRARGAGRRSGGPRRQQTP